MRFDRELCDGVVVVYLVDRRGKSEHRLCAVYADSQRIVACDVVDRRPDILVLLDRLDYPLGTLLNAL